MDKNSMLTIVKKLEFDLKKCVYKDASIRVLIFRPSVLSKRFKSYDAKKNFQIWLEEGKREFRPNHLRVMIDLNLRVRSRGDLKEKLLSAFDGIFYGKDPVKELTGLKGERFEHYLNPLNVIGVLSQLFIIEQEYCYHRESNFDPPTLFYQGWVREFIDNPKEIDNLCMNVCSGQPPLAKYVAFENKKNRNFKKNLGSLWYLSK